MKRSTIFSTRGIFVFYFIVILVWTAYRVFFHFSEPVDEFLFKPLIFLMPTFLWVALREKRNLVSLGFSGKNFFRNFLIGLLLGLFFAAEGVAVSVFKYKELIFNPQNLGIMGLLMAGLISIATAFSEEVLNRGFLMSRLWEKWRNEWVANLVSSFLFALSHLPMGLLVLKYSGFDLAVYEFSVFVLGAVDGYVFGRTRNIFAPTASHALWNWSVTLFR